ncbi:hypothetical protein Patl1_02778 [Pistacia atlantica]|uniref:Uncharacterized protein n=1 Tax=Pistacia atlantica TaxID=434234 RepID=A0ACC1CD52_9ROSI|nr:hypothetical protein Patl1_02778 [Pistacia atlantica]
MMENFGGAENNAADRNFVLLKNIRLSGEEFYV